MTDLMRPTLDRIEDLYKRTSGTVTLRWGTVVTSLPLSVRLDGEADPLGIVPVSLVPVLMPGERVVCAAQHRRVTVLLAAGRTGPLRGTSAQRIALGLTGLVKPGQSFFDEDENREYVWAGGWKASSRRLHGPAADRSSVTPGYFDFWHETDGDYRVWVGGRSGNWRRYSGKHEEPAAAWASSAHPLYGRTISATLPTVLESGETIMVSGPLNTAGYDVLSLNTVTPHATDTDIQARFFRFNNSGTSSVRVHWKILPGADIGG